METISILEKRLALLAVGIEEMEQKQKQIADQYRLVESQKAAMNERYKEVRAKIELHYSPGAL
jgi:hypothetical protein